MSKSTGYEWGPRKTGEKPCRAHKTGVAAGSRPFYTPGCPACERKLAAGQVSKTDPLQPQRFWKIARRALAGGRRA